jgi:hypothetical protein
MIKMTVKFGKKIFNIGGERFHQSSHSVVGTGHMLGYKID